VAETKGSLNSICTHSSQLAVLRKLEISHDALRCHVLPAGRLNAKFRELIIARTLKKMKDNHMLDFDFCQLPE